MKVEQSQNIGFFDVDHRFHLTFQAAARFFQEAATHHSTKVGAGYQDLQKKRIAWYLSRLEIEVLSSPKLMDPIRVLTWSRKIEGVKGIREYRIESGSGEVLVKGSSVWLFYSLKEKRIARVPEEIVVLYQPEAVGNFDHELDQVDFGAATGFAYETQIGLRYSDFDVNQHVNNTIYPGIFESLYHEHKEPKAPPIRNMKISFKREIGIGTRNITAGWDVGDLYYRYFLGNGSTVFAMALLQPKG